ncbi:LL-diaminopimelate aminotransferase [Halalkalibacterium halodurans]|uniref:Aminotransferase n=1 Tax=Halalkalibacterium halodurans TaxID=86665 RepID=A0A0M0KDC5_ALKHA|nr:LL-diaminopimelate aminotransferase [Halalkalibacterium halodurans]TPE70381.1 LL-diaminopimelate aminotransferase [Halalkalibacterium halodurans]
MIKPSRRLAPLATSVFTELANMKEAYKQDGRELIDLSIGSPDLPPPHFVLQKMNAYVSNPNQYGYAITGLAAFHEAVAQFYQRRYQVNVNPRQVLSLMGSQDGLAHLALAYVDAGDLLLAPDPGYPIYAASAHIAGAELYTYPLNEANQFMFDVETLPDDVKQRAKLMIVNYPGNPTAAMADAAYFEKLVAFGIKHNILIVHDYAYSELLFDQREALSIFSVPRAFETAIEFNSLSKSFNIAGARIGYAIGAESILQPLAALKSHLDYGVFLPVQYGAIEALEHGDAFLETQRELYEKRRNTFVEALQLNGWTVSKPGGGMFIWAKIPDDGRDAMSFVKHAMEHAGVIVTPGHAFGNEGEGYVRMALVQPETELRKAANQLAQIL